MKEENQNIREVIIAYANAVDVQNTIEAGRYLEANFRVVLNSYKNLPEPTVLSREQYLALMKQGKLGGTRRSLSIEFIDSNQTVAIAKLSLESEKTVFKTYYQLIRKSTGWFILSDTPEITMVNNN